MNSDLHTLNTGLLRHKEKDLVFMASWDGFQPFKDMSRKSMTVATLALLNLPPALRMRADLQFVWWGLSGHKSNINPFLQVALQEFVTNFHEDFIEPESAWSYRVNLDLHLVL